MDMQPCGDCHKYSAMTPSNQQTPRMFDADCRRRLEGLTKKTKVILAILLIAACCSAPLTKASQQRSQFKTTDNSAAAVSVLKLSTQSKSSHASHDKMNMKSHISNAIDSTLSSGSLTPSMTSTPTSQQAEVLTLIATSLPTTPATYTTTLASTSSSLSASTARGGSSIAPSTELPAPSSSTAPFSHQSSTASPAATNALTNKIAASESNKRRTHAHNHSSSDNRQQQKSERDPIDQMSTGQSASFAEPATAESSQQQQQLRPQHKGANNRWTHFGARLKPLTGAADHHVAAANSKSFSAASPDGNQRSPVRQQQFYPQAQSAAQQEQPANGGRNNNALDATDEDADDDLDSEALLYKMMQQQNFLMNPDWQQQQELANNNQRQRADNQMGFTSAANQQRQSQQQQQQGGANQRPQQLPQSADNFENSKKVIKLLKSYSHIHQVDDSDDQIRGTYTRVSARRPTTTEPSSGQRGYYATNNRSNNRSKQPQGQHIFVSSQPMTRAQSIQTSGRQYQQPPPQMARSNQQGANFQPTSDSENYQSFGGGEGDGNSAAAESDGSSPQEEDDFECPNNGIFADVASGCQAYHVCQSGAQVQQRFQCPLGTLFNDIILTCDFAHNVQCNGKPKQQPEPQQEAPVYQEQPRQLVRLEGGNSRSMPAPVPRLAQSGPPLQPKWSQPQQQQPPRQPAPRSQYNQHQQMHQSSQIQAVNPYPKSPGVAAVTIAANDKDDEDSSDEPPVPLRPAMLPPPRNAAPTSQLPYNPPPPPQPQQYPQKSQNSPAPMGYQQQQPQQRPQYPLGNNYNQPRQPYAAYGTGFDGASVSTPIFANKDEPTTTPARSQQSGYTSTPPNQATNYSNPQQDSFNIVINHMAPTRTQTAAHQPSGANSYKAKSNQAISSDQQTYGTAANEASALAVGNRKELAKKQQAYLKLAADKPNGPNPKFTSSTANRVQQDSYGKPQPQQRLSKGPQYMQQASLVKAVHISEEPVQTSRRPALIDLTHNKQGNGVSSEALNEGLLLIVRHGSSSEPIQISRQNANGAIYGAAGGKQGQQARQQSASRPSPKTVKHSSTGQAFAVDPNAVRADSPVDAQLFPNVQQTIATAQSRPLVIHQAPQVTNKSEQSAQTTTIGYGTASRVSPPLVPMKPPKPLVEAEDKTYFAVAAPSLSLKASKSKRQQTIEDQQKQLKAQKQQQSSKRAVKKARPTSTTAP